VNFEWPPKKNTSWIDLTILAHKKTEKRVYLFQQVLLHLDIGCNSCSTLNWISKLCGDTFGHLGCLGVNVKKSNFSFKA